MLQDHGAASRVRAFRKPSRPASGPKADPVPVLC